MWKCSFGLLAALGLALGLFLVPGCGRSTENKDRPGSGQADKEVVAGNRPLRIAYSDWPGWLVLEIARQKDFFKDAGVDVELVWFADYGESVDGYTTGNLDGILIACGDSLSAKSSVIIVLTDYSDGNDMIIAREGIKACKDLRGKTVGLEKDRVEHMLLLEALKRNELTQDEVKIKDIKTQDTMEALKSGIVDAVGAWYPISRQTLAEVAGSHALFTSKDAPGLIYDALQVDPESLRSRRGEWKKVVSVWLRCLRFLDDPKTHKQAVEIMARRIEGKPEALEKSLKGIHLLDAEGNRKHMRKLNTLDSIYGSLEHANRFYLERKVYEKSVKVDPMIDPSLIEELVSKGARSARVK